MIVSESGPELSLLLVADSIASIMHTIRNFGEGIDKTRLEVVVVSRNGQVLMPDVIIAEGFTYVQSLSVSSDSYDEAELRAVHAATAPWIVFALPNAYPQPGFVDSWRAAKSSGDWCVIGPALSTTASQNPLSRASIWIFSGAWLNAPPRGAMNSAPGHHSVYRREALLGLGNDLASLLVAGEQLLVTLRSRGCRFLIEPDMQMTISMPEKPGEFIECMFRNSRIYAYKRRQGWSLLRRLAYVAGAPFIPFVRIPRLCRHIHRAGKVREAILDAPFLLAGLALSAAGEWFGYLFGQGEAWRFEPGC